MARITNRQPKPSRKIALQRGGMRPSHSRSSFAARPSPIRLTTPPWLFWSCILTITTTVSATLGAIVAVLAPEPPVYLSFPQQPQGLLFEFWQSRFQFRLTRPVNLLILGIDGELAPSAIAQDPFSGRSDTILLLRLDPNSDSVNILSIPRDTQALVPELGWVKMSQVNALGGAELSLQVMSQTFNQLPIERYIRISTGAFRELVDLVDGVEVFVERPMSYVDYTQNLTINLSPGWQTLNGQQAEEFVRFRSDEFGDIGRVQRQQLLIKALRHRFSNPTVLPRLPKILQVMQKYVDTNLSSDELLALMSFGLKTPPEGFKMVMLPGRYSDRLEYPTSYWLVEAADRDRILRDYFQRHWMTTQWGDPKNPTGQRDLSGLKIAIDNATGSPAASEQLATYLEEQGYQDLYFVRDSYANRNLPRLHQTQIIVQKGDLKSAQHLQSVLGIGRIEATSTGDIDSDLTLRIGADWLTVVSQNRR
ncbi:MAG: LCP family protein [Desertifilum sp.]|nr:LCP family protein [Desertifilum sp.]